MGLGERQEPKGVIPRHQGLLGANRGTDTGGEGSPRESLGPGGQGPTGGRHRRRAERVQGSGWTKT